jgi:thiol-disulfide isomerase/thioredoxin
VQRLATSAALVLALGAPALAALVQARPTREPQRWRAELETPGGALPFGLDLAEDTDGWRAELVNEPEQIPIVVERWDGRELALLIPPYESRITARLEGTELAGTWTKRRSATRVAEIPFRARPGYEDRFPRKATRTPPARLAGRWSVDFETDELPAVAVLEQPEGARELRGTFLTATGDHRYLAGAVDGDELALSCFDGAHAFLYRAKVQPDGTLAGDFWSGSWHHERWTARRDDTAALADPFAQTTWREGASLADLVFSDLQGNPRSLAEPVFAGKATLLVVFGTWCPNCNDEAKLLVELDAKYRARGLSILGLAFELTGDFAWDSAALRRFAERHGVRYPLLLAGVSDKDAASRAIPLLDRVRAYPTTIFLAGDGAVRAVHSGYSGPATGVEHARLRARFEELIERLLAEGAREETGRGERDG